MPPRFGGFFPSSFTKAFRPDAGGVGQNTPCLLPTGGREGGWGGGQPWERRSTLRTENGEHCGWDGLGCEDRGGMCGARILRGAAAGAVPAAPSAVPSLQTAPRPCRSGEAEQPSLPTSSRYRFSVFAQSLPQNRICRDFFFSSNLPTPPPPLPTACSLAACTLSISGRAPPSSAPFVSFQPSA